MTDPVNQSSTNEKPLFVREVLFFEIAIILVIALFYGKLLLNLDPTYLQQTGEHNEGSTLAILAEKSIREHGEIPRWNPYILTGLPFAGDPLTEFFNPISAISYTIFGAIPGLRISVLIAFVIAGVGQLVLGYVLGFRSSVRLWSAILFMLSGGVVMLWRLGWYTYIFGVVWFPFCMAFVLWALTSKARLPIALAAISNTMLFLSGSIYWTVYFIGCMLVITIFAFTASRFGNKVWGDYRSIFIKLGVISILTVGLTAILLLPMTDFLSFAGREVLPELEQRGSQTIPHAMFNYVVADFDYYMSAILEKNASGSWFYIGVLPLLLLIFVPIAYSKRKYGGMLILMTILLIFLLAWQANRHTPFGVIYQWLPVLNNLRFPNRLLIVAASVLIGLSGFGLEYLFDKAKSIKFSIGLFPTQETEKKGGLKSVSISYVLEVVLIIFLAVSLRQVFLSNQAFGFSDGTMDEGAHEAMSWLKQHDSSVYYVNVGNWPIIWAWLPAAYENEHKVINFQYGRLLKSWGSQTDPETPIRASEKYTFIRTPESLEAPAILVHSFPGVDLYQWPDSLPYAFTLSEQLVEDGIQITPLLVNAVSSRFDGPNRIVVETFAIEDGMLLTVLESYYPGWKVYVDGDEQSVEPVGDYLGVEAAAGSHTYIFSFEPVKFTYGWIISLFTLIIVILLAFSDRYKQIIEYPVALYQKLSSTKSIPNAES